MQVYVSCVWSALLSSHMTWLYFCFFVVSRSTSPTLNTLHSDRHNLNWKNYRELGTHGDGRVVSYVRSYLLSLWQATMPWLRPFKERRLYSPSEESSSEEEDAVVPCSPRVQAAPSDDAVVPVAPIAQTRERLDASREERREERQGESDSEESSSDYP